MLGEGEKPKGGKLQTLGDPQGLIQNTSDSYSRCMVWEHILYQDIEVIG